MPHYPRWSDNEICVLNDNFPRLAINGRSGPITKKSLMNLLPKKTWDAIKWKARMLGLKRDFRVVYPKLDFSDVDKAYIAGFLDGEGCLGFTKAVRKSGVINYFPYVTISNNDLDVLKWIEELIGFGNVRRLKHPPESKRTREWNQNPSNWKPCYTYGIHNLAGVYRFLTDFKDLIRVKRENAELLIEYMEIKASKPPAKAIRDENTGLFIRRIALERLPREDEIYKRIRELNSRGWRKYD